MSPDQFQKSGRGRRRHRARSATAISGTLPPDAAVNGTDNPARFLTRRSRVRPCTPGPNRHDQPSGVFSRTQRRKATARPNCRTGPPMPAGWPQSWFRRGTDPEASRSVSGENDRYAGGYSVFVSSSSASADGTDVPASSEVPGAGTPGSASPGPARGRALGGPASAFFAARSLFSSRN